MVTFTRAAATLLTCIMLLVAAPLGCAALASALPTVLALVLDGMQVLDTIEAFVAHYFVQNPDAKAQEIVRQALTRCRAALNVALRSAQGAERLDQAQVDAAFDEFKKAYIALMSLVGPLGVRQVHGSTLRASLAADGKLEVPEPLAFSRQR